jgi:hypothetical protein
MRKSQKEEIYRKEELKQSIMEWGLGIFVFLLGVGIMGVVIWLATTG